LDLYELEFVLTLFKIYDIDVFYFILFEFMIKYIFLNNFINTRRYPWIFVNMKKIDRYPHNRYPMDMSMGTRRIFIQQVGYKGATTRTLPTSLTFLVVKLFMFV